MVWPSLDLDTLAVPVELTVLLGGRGRGGVAAFASSSKV